MANQLDAPRRLPLYASLLIVATSLAPAWASGQRPIVPDSTAKADTVGGRRPVLLPTVRTEAARVERRRRLVGAVGVFGSVATIITTGLAVR